MGVPFPVGSKKDVSSGENLKKFFLFSFDLTAFIELPCDRKSGYCSVKRITL
jgi:hypothetical protein